MAFSKHTVASVRIVFAIIVAATGVLGSSELLFLHKIGELSFAVFVCMSVLIGLAIAFGDRLESLSFRELKIELGKVEAARKDVEQREQQVRRTALALAEITMFLAAFQHRMGSEETHDLETQWFSRKVGELLDTIYASTPERENTFRFIEAVKHMDAVRERDPKASEAQWDAVWKLIRDDLTRQP